MEHNEIDFSLNDFKKWISTKKEPRNFNAKLIGCYIESKLSPKRLIKRMSIDQGDIKEMAKDFKRYGGTVLDVEKDGMLLVEVSSGSFRISKYFVVLN